MSIAHWPMDERPREKLRHYGSGALSNAELLAILLGQGTKGKSALTLSQDLLNHFRSLSHLFEASYHEMTQFPGVGLCKYAQIQAAIALSQRHFQAPLMQRPTIEHIDHVKQFCKMTLHGHPNEVFGCLFLNQHHRALCFEKLFHGTINQASVHPRVIVARALYHNAAAVIFSHNHPSGELTPSESDHVLTHLLTDTLARIDIAVLDHIIVTQESSLSFREKGWLPNSSPIPEAQSRYPQS
jgi:DNA repair protein RadC